jgi:ATP-dependent RNA helicase DHR2
MTTENSAPPAKRRKTKTKDPNVITIGGKTISLEGYLTAPAPKPEKVAAPATPTVAAEPEKEKKERKELHLSERPRRSFKDRQNEKSRSREDPKLLKTRKQLPIWQ